VDLSRSPPGNAVTVSPSGCASHATDGIGRYPFSSDCVAGTSAHDSSRPSVYRNGSMDGIPIPVSTIPSALIVDSRVSPLIPTTVQ
jgi:hypothetical protein